MTVRSGHADVGVGYGSVVASTLDGLETCTAPVAAWGRRLALGLIALAVAADVAGLFGVHTGTVSASGGGYDLTLKYPTVARAGLDTKWQVRVHHPGGFGKQVTLAVTGDYFDIFESQGMFPEPSDETRDGRNLLLTFAAPPGETLVIDYDAYIQPASQLGRSATVSVLRGATPLVSVAFTTRLVP